MKEETREQAIKNLNRFNHACGWFSIGAGVVNLLWIIVLVLTGRF